MKKALLVIAAVATAASVFAQTTDGNILFQNRNIHIASGALTGGGNGNGSYNVPLFQTGGTTGAGLLPGGVTVGLFLTSDLNTPLATTTLGTTANTATLFANPPSSSPTVTGNAPGTTPSLTIRAWQGSSFAAAQATAGQEWGEWTFTAPPLGGQPATGAPIQTPTLTGWGNENGAGFSLTTTGGTVPEPTTIAFSVLGMGALFLCRRKQA
jgi:hypothetical protein